MPEAERRSAIKVEKGHTLIGAVTGSHVAAILMAGFLAFFTVMPSVAQEGPTGGVYSPCWSKEECLNINAGDTSSVTSRAGQGDCANGHCWCSGASCRDPRFRNTTCPTGQGHCYSNPPPVPLVVAIGGATRVVDLGDYIAKVYNYGVSIAGILAGVMLVVGGFGYVTAGGDSGRVSRAKDRIRDALVGLLLVLCAFVILNTVNPDTLRLQMPKIPIIRKKLFVACGFFEGQRPCGERFFIEPIPGVPESRPISERYRIATNVTASTATTTECIGMSCSRAGSDDAAFRCRRNPSAAAPTGNPPPPSANACTSEPVAPYQCTPCIAQRGECRGTGRNNSCCGGFCMAGAPGAMLGEVGALASSAGIGGSVFTGVCSNGNNGLQCGTDAECFSGHCADLLGSRAGGVCVSGNDGAPCSDDRHCNSPRVCVEMTGINVCVKPDYMSPCAEANDCTGGLQCHNHRCGGNMTMSCSNNSDCSDANLNASLRPYGPMFCWRKERNIIADNVYICKPKRPGTVCHPGQDFNDACEGICFDGAITDRSATDANAAGLCVRPEGGMGCDETSDCQRFDSMSACREYNGISNRGCTYGGAEGMPCVGGGGSVSNTCQSGLTCPATVYRCVRPPGCPTP